MDLIGEDTGTTGVPQFTEVHQFGAAEHLADRIVRIAQDRLAAAAMGAARPKSISATLAVRWCEDSVHFMLPAALGWAAEMGGELCCGRFR